MISKDCNIHNSVKTTSPVNLYGCTLKKDAFVGPFVEIQKDALIDEGTRVQSHTFICSEVTVGKNCFIEPGITFHNCKSYSNLTIGDNCYVGKNCFFDLRDKITIGNNVTISMQCILLTHQDMGKSTLVKLYNHTQSPLTIGDNVYIGAGVIILQGLKINREVIIAAGSVVKDNADERTIIGGVPARFLKKLSN